MATQKPSSFYQISILLVLLFWSANLHGSEGLCISDEGTSDRNSNLLFKSDELLEFTLMGEFVELMQDRGDDRSYHKGKLYYLDVKGDTIFRKVRLKARGNFRRKEENCKRPPVAIKFKKLKSKDSIFTNQTKLKLVTHCQEERYVLQEYLAYRIFNAITDKSYKVRLAKITYAELETAEKYNSRFAFFIESEDELIERMNAKDINGMAIQSMLERKSVITTALFQYMIGNNDWFVTSKHNTSVLESNLDGQKYAVPYDFDWSEFVNAPYTKPEGAEEWQLENRMVYKGLCMKEEDYKEQVELFLSKKEAIIAVIEDAPSVAAINRKTAKKFVNQFYKTLQKPNSLKKIFQQQSCQKDLKVD